MRRVVSPLLVKIQRREAKVGVVGLGYVGLPLGMAFAEAGFPVTGIDVDERKVRQLEKGESYIRHIASEPLARLAASRRFGATTDFSKAKELDCVVICVPTPLTSTREPDLTYVVGAAEALAPHVRPDQLYVLESTTYPGTTDEVVRPILERGGLKAGRDFHLAFSPEREDPGNGQFHTRNIPKVVGGYTPSCLEVAQALYGCAVERTVPVSSTRIAELAKLLENIFRCVNIALVNELKMVCDRMGVDIWEVIHAASSKPFGFMPFYPGPGLGGHCIPIDPFYLSWKAREFGVQTRFIELAGEVNNDMPHYVLQRTMEALNERGRPLKGARLLVLGVAYKKDVDDVRESPALTVMSLLKKRGARLDYHDPFVPRLEPAHGLEHAMTSVPLDYERLGQYDAVVVLTDHTGIDYDRVVEKASLVVDTRNTTWRVRRRSQNVVTA